MVVKCFFIFLIHALASNRTVVPHIGGPS